MWSKGTYHLYFSLCLSLLTLTVILLLSLLKLMLIVVSLFMFIFVTCNSLLLAVAPYLSLLITYRSLSTRHMSKRRKHKNIKTKFPNNLRAGNAKQRYLPFVCLSLSVAQSHCHCPKGKGKEEEEIDKGAARVHWGVVTG